ncbi:MAG: NAD-dependent epimerase/dehydratase family protein [Actinomycetota bacterium]
MAERSKLTVAVTGCSGYIAGRLIASLCDDPRVERVLGFDVKEPRVSHPRFVFDPMDVRDRALQKRFAGCDAVVHLAFIMDPIRDESMMRDVNVNGSHNVFWCAGEAGVGKIVYPSSATVYGAHPDNDVPLTEESPLRANLDFSYPAHKLEVEYVVREFRKEFSETIFTLFRPAIVFGPHVDNAWSHVLELPLLVGVRGYRPPIQFVHEDDVARAVTHAVLDGDLDGDFNLAPGDWLEAEEALTILNRRRVEFSEPAAFALLEAMWGLGLAEAPAGMFHYLMHPWVVSADKLADEGFVCTHSSREVFRQTVERTERYVRVGNTRVRRVRLRVAAAAGIGALGSLAVAGEVLRRRHRAA